MSSLIQYSMAEQLLAVVFPITCGNHVGLKTARKTSGPRTELSKLVPKISQSGTKYDVSRSCTAKSKPNSRSLELFFGLSQRLKLWVIEKNTIFTPQEGAQEGGSAVYPPEVSSGTQSSGPRVYPVETTYTHQLRTICCPESGRALSQCPVRSDYALPTSN